MTTNENHLETTMSAHRPNRCERCETTFTPRKIGLVWRNPSDLRDASKDYRTLPSVVVCEKCASRLTVVAEEAGANFNVRTYLGLDDGPTDEDLGITEEEREHQERIEQEHAGESHYDESTNPSSGWRCPSDEEL